MKTARLIKGILALSVLTFVLGLADEASGPSIEGAYTLDHRELPDGTQMRPPQIMGMINFTKEHRNFNVYWEENGKRVSISAICKYSLAGGQYTEESLYYAVNDEVAGKGLTYETTPVRGSSPVTVTGDRIEFQLPLHDEPKLAFDKSGFTATRQGAFVDHWTKIE